VARSAAVVAMAQHAIETTTVRVPWPAAVASRHDVVRKRPGRYLHHRRHHYLWNCSGQFVWTFDSLHHSRQQQDLAPNRSFTAPRQIIMASYEVSVACPLQVVCRLMTLRSGLRYIRSAFSFAVIDLGIFFDWLRWAKETQLPMVLKEDVYWVTVNHGQSPQTWFQHLVATKDADAAFVVEKSLPEEQKRTGNASIDAVTSQDGVIIVHLASIQTQELRFAEQK
jgi:hypothetical protein